jgi:glycosyltransferase involved in cell wall biosynthesis
VNIAILSWESLYGPAWSDAAVIASETARALAEAGHEVHVFTACGPGQAAECSHDGAHYHRCAHDRDLDPRKELESFTGAVLSRLRRAGGQTPFSVVHGFEWPTAGILGELRHTSGQATAWSFLRPDGGWMPPRWLIEHPDADPVWSHHPEDFADRILAPSEHLKRSFLEHWGLPWERVAVAHPGVDPGWPGGSVDPATVKARFGWDTFDPVVLFMGHLTPAARPGLLLDAMPMVLERHPNAKAIFAGHGEMAEFLLDRATVLDVAHAVQCTGATSTTVLAQLCQSCDAVCLPQQSTSLLSPHLQAWAASKPVVITTAHAAAAFVWHEVTGYVTGETAGQIASGILWLFADFERCRWVGANGRQAVDDAFGWPAVAERILDCYQRAAAERGPVART